MSRSPQSRTPAELSELLREIAVDAETLMEQQLRLVRAEIREELGRAGEAAVAVGAGAGLVAAGGLLASLALVHALQRATRLPLWSCYGLVAGLLGASGASLIAVGRTRAAGVHLLPPPVSAESLKENLSWLREQVTTLATD